MAVKPAMAALADAKLQPRDIDLLIVATASPDTPLPSTACQVQHKLGVPAHATCFDIAAACSGFLYALEIAYGHALTNRYKRALIIGAEKLSTVVDWKDRTTCVLFGDGAGAVVLGTRWTSRDRHHRLRLGADGDSTDLLYISAGGSKRPADRRSPSPRAPLHPDEWQGSLQTRRPRHGRPRPAI
jgi:3-oxoacyl-[acyl-carrier-protein] synthase-3